MKRVYIMYIMGPGEYEHNEPVELERYNQWKIFQGFLIKSAPISLVKTISIM